MLSFIVEYVLALTLKINNSAYGTKSENSVSSIHFRYSSCSPIEQNYFSNGVVG
jgi:hypothetical protein